MPDVGKVRLGYWRIRGFGAPPRMLLHYADIDFEDVTYTVKRLDDGSFWREWDSDPLANEMLSESSKAYLAAQKNPYANLPWLEHDGQFVTQSNAVIMYIGRLANLNGDSESEISKNEQVLFQIYDLRYAALMLAYGPPEAADGTRAEDSYFGNIMPSFFHTDGRLNVHLTKLESWLKFNGTSYFSADRPLTADFHVFEVLDLHEGWAAHLKKGSLLENYPLLKDFYERMLALDGLKSYFASDASKWTYHSPRALTFPGNINGYGPDRVLDGKTFMFADQ